MKACPAMIVCAVRSVRSPRIGLSRCLSWLWSASIRLLACRSTWCHADGTSSSRTAGYTGAASVTTSVGRTFNVASARRKNRRAAAASRRAETSTSMTWPSWSTARYTYRQTPLTLT